MPPVWSSLAFPVLGAASSTSGNGGVDVGTLGQYGALGVLNAVLILFARQAYNREKERADKNEGEVARLNQLIQDKYVPSLEATKNALQETQTFMRERDERFRSMITKVEDFLRQESSRPPPRRRTT